LLVDTGSSAMVFCDKDLANSNAVTVITYPGDSNSLGGTNVLDFGQPNEQCNGGSFIISNSYGGNPDMYFYGYVYTGNVSISSHGSTDTKVIPGVAFTIAEDSGNDFICNQDKKIDGIWGVGFSEAGDGAFVMMPGFNDPSDVRCINQAPDSCSSSTYDQNAEWCFNEGANNTYFLLKTVLQKSLELKREYLTQKDWSLFGICLTTPLSDLSQLINSPITYNAAVAFGGSLAIQNNTCYNPDSIDAVVDSDSNGAFWTLPITSMHVFCGSSSNPLVSFGTSQAGESFLDSGTPKLVLPQSIVDEITSCSETDGSLKIQMDGGELTMELKDLQYLKKNHLLEGSSSGGSAILGFPTFFFYYIVFDYADAVEGKSKLTFVKK